MKKRIFDISFEAETEDFEPVQVIVEYTLCPKYDFDIYSINVFKESPVEKIEVSIRDHYKFEVKATELIYEKIRKEAV